VCGLQNEEKSPGIVISSPPIGNYVMSMVLESTITCPFCGHQASERMPTDACVFFYTCKGCGKTLKPREGDCCVFCSYGSVPCPFMQEAGGCKTPG